MATSEEIFRDAVALPPDVRSEHLVARDEVFSALEA